jgi:hypothetical protein
MTTANDPPAPFTRRDDPSAQRDDAATPRDGAAAPRADPAVTRGDSATPSSPVGFRPRGRRRVARLVEAGLLHPTSVAMIDALPQECAELLYWGGRNLDASASLDDVVQAIALARLEAQAAACPPGARLRQETQRRLRRETWSVRTTRGRFFHEYWTPESLRAQVGPDGGLAEIEEVAWDDVVRILGWPDGLVVWLWAVENWTLEQVGTFQAVTRQQVWRRLRRGLARLRTQLTPARRPTRVRKPRPPRP